MADPIKLAMAAPPPIKLRGLTARERHILRTALVKRKVMAAAWKSLRKQNRRRANQQFTQLRLQRRGYCQT